MTPVMDEPGDSATRSRRWFLAGGAAAVLAGAGGATAALLLDSSPARPPVAPAALLAAVAAERALIADLDATTGGAAPVRRVIVQVRADHAAHLAALQRLLGQFRRPSPAAASSPRMRGTPRTLAQLRAAEQRASSAAATHAGALDGGLAALLASIAACEATHAELLQ
jgi:hypothetical protein